VARLLDVHQGLSSAHADAPNRGHMGLDIPLAQLIEDGAHGLASPAAMPQVPIPMVIVVPVSIRVVSSFCT